MRDIVMWASIVGILGAGPALIAFGIWHTFSRKPVEEKYQGAGGGLGGAFDAVWSPSAHEAGQERDRQQRASVPAPTPDKGPGRMDDGRVVIEVAEP